jgi:hypothetical protein
MIPTVVKQFHAEYVYGEDYTLAYGFGMVKRIVYDEAPVYPGLMLTRFDLVYARIQSKEFGTLVSVHPHAPAMPEKALLFQNYPNPFNPKTAVSYQLSAVSKARISVIDMLGREVAVLVENVQPPGVYTVTWDASGFPSGVYLCRMTVGRNFESRKMLLVR